MTLKYTMRFFMHLCTGPVIISVFADELNSSAIKASRCNVILLTVTCNGYPFFFASKFHDESPIIKRKIV